MVVVVVGGGCVAVAVAVAVVASSAVVSWHCTKTMKQASVNGY